ncbi:hypothetical protein N7509_006958 [Penicillium cosmopolitanum]|uniref:Uncharacterized protein n=1 Tax=Penicillium cosmopolitanum TaxID=1131564 RepID=A0A9W9VXW3_9EURO|nr:uncharacterized protein N7509_006958 [Penicillium cosmopolitanum]KAJ5391468.1 hypothetical protein N7509_006958 [Penicillium cosmopolitanum]
MTLENSNTLEAKVNAEVVDNPENARDSTNVIKSATPGYSKIGQSVIAHIRGTRLRSREH